MKLIAALLVSLPIFLNAQDKTLLKKYAGTYHMVAAGQKVTSTSDKYVLTPDGKGTWIMATTVNADGTTSNKPTKIPGSWSASDGMIILNFNMGADKGGEMISEFTMSGPGVFKAEGVELRKSGAGAAKAKK